MIDLPSCNTSCPKSPATTVATASTFFSVSALIKSAIHSASSRFIFSLKKALLENSPGSANLIILFFLERARQVLLKICFIPKPP